MPDTHHPAKIVYGRQEHRIISEKAAAEGLLFALTCLCISRQSGQHSPSLLCLGWVGCPRLRTLQPTWYRYAGADAVILILVPPDEHYNPHAMQPLELPFQTQRVAQKNISQQPRNLQPHLSSASN